MTIGEQLRQARNVRKLSIAEVTQQTKIQPWVLEALEADRLPELMNPVYVKGFLATYARFLRLEPEALVSQLAPPQPEPEPAAMAAPPATIPVAIHIPWQTLGRATAIAATVLFLGVVIVRTHPLQRVQQFAHYLQAKVASSKAHGARAAAKRQPSKPVAQANVPTPVQPQLASVTPVHETPKPTPPPAVSIQPIQPLELVVTATRATWIQVRADGKLLTQQWLKRGADEHWTAKKRFEVVVSKPSQVELKLNGQSISPFAISHRGRLVITHQGITALPED